MKALKEKDIGVKSCTYDNPRLQKSIQYSRTEKEAKKMQNFHQKQNLLTLLNSNIFILITFSLNLNQTFKQNFELTVEKKI